MMTRPRFASLIGSGPLRAATAQRSIMTVGLGQGSTSGSGSSLLRGPRRYAVEHASKARLRRTVLATHCGSGDQHPAIPSGCTQLPTNMLFNSLSLYFEPAGCCKCSSRCHQQEVTRYTEGEVLWARGGSGWLCVSRVTLRAGEGQRRIAGIGLPGVRLQGCRQGRTEVDAEQHVAQRVGRRGQPASLLQGCHAGPGRAVARDDVAQSLVKLLHVGDLPRQENRYSGAVIEEAAQ